jgi:hypothetical protein
MRLIKIEPSQSSAQGWKPTYCTPRNEISLIYRGDVVGEKEKWSAGWKMGLLVVFAKQSETTCDYPWETIIPLAMPQPSYFGSKNDQFHQQSDISRAS